MMSFLTSPGGAAEKVSQVKGRTARASADQQAEFNDPGEVLRTTLFVVTRSVLHARGHVGQRRSFSPKTACCQAFPPCEVVSISCCGGRCHGIH